MERPPCIVLFWDTHTSSIPSELYNSFPDFDLKEWNNLVELLLKSGVNPRARDLQGFSPLHLLMERVCGITESTLTESGDRFAYHRQLLYEVVRSIHKYGGCPHATTNDGRTVFDICKDDELLEKMRQDLINCECLTLSRLAATAIRKHQLQYHGKLPPELIKLVELYY